MKNDLVKQRGLNLFSMVHKLHNTFWSVKLQFDLKFVLGSKKNHGDLKFVLGVKKKKNG